MMLICHKAKSDFVIINGLSHPITSESPLNKYPLIKYIKEKLISYRTRAYDDPCDSYNAEWTVVNNELYLTNIYSCNDTKLEHKTDLAPLFNDGLVKVKNGMVKAVWFTGNLWVATGKQIYTQGDILMYDAESCFEIINSKVNSMKNFNYPHPEGLFYIGAIDGTEVVNFIYSHISWNKFPKLMNQKKRIIVGFETGPSGKPKNVKIIRENPQDSTFNNEALRVFNLIPLGAYYRHGQLFKQQWTLPITFNEEMRQKYFK